MWPPHRPLLGCRQGPGTPSRCQLADYWFFYHHPLKKWRRNGLVRSGFILRPLKFLIWFYLRSSKSHHQASFSSGRDSGITNLQWVCCLLSAETLYLDGQWYPCRTVWLAPPSPRSHGLLPRAWSNPGYSRLAHSHEGPPKVELGLWFCFLFLIFELTCSTASRWSCCAAANSKCL